MLQKGFVMLATLFRTSCIAAVAFASGCAMCTSCDDFCYSAYGGRWERLDPCFGRVGSAFTPEVGMRVDDAEVVEAAGDGNPEELLRPEPTPADNRVEPPALNEAPSKNETSILHDMSTETQ